MKFLKADRVGNGLLAWNSFSVLAAAQHVTLSGIRDATELGVNHCPSTRKRIIASLKLAYVYESVGSTTSWLLSRPNGRRFEHHCYVAAFRSVNHVEADLLGRHSFSWSTKMEKELTTQLHILFGVSHCKIESTI
jgi:hypothetical protein